MPKQESPDFFFCFHTKATNVGGFTLVCESEVDLNLLTCLVSQSVHGRIAVYLFSAKQLCVPLPGWSTVTGKSLFTYIVLETKRIRN